MVEHWYLFFAYNKVIGPEKNLSPARFVDKNDDYPIVSPLIGSTKYYHKSGVKPSAWKISCINSSTLSISETC